VAPTSTPIGVRLWYADGTVVEHRVDLDLAAAWAAWPATGVQVMMVYYAETYRVWTCDRWDERGRAVNGRYVTEHRCDNPYQGADAYWYEPVGGTFGMGATNEAPLGALLKRGSTIPDAEWYPLVNAAQDSRVAPTAGALVG
jgi:hypothetical protein